MASPQQQLSKVLIRSEAVILYKLEAPASGLRVLNRPLARASSLYVRERKSIRASHWHPADC